MKTIETTARVNREGTLVIELASDLPPGTHRAVIVIDEVSSAPVGMAEEMSGQEMVKPPAAEKTAWSALRTHAGSVDMPEDWAKEHDHYLYNTSKRQT